MSYATIDDLRSHLGGRPEPSAAYAAKMLHPLPPFKSVDRARFILKHCTRKRVLEFGASGPMHDGIVSVATFVQGYDLVAAPGVDVYDLDAIGNGMQESFIPFASYDLIVCGEILEHLSNPGWFLRRLKLHFSGVPLIVTVPNAFAAAAANWIRKGQENVNKDHVAWYSPTTLGVLLERAGYTVGDLYWYGGTDATAEGLLVCTE